MGQSKLSKLIEGDHAMLQSALKVFCLIAVALSFTSAVISQEQRSRCSSDGTCSMTVEEFHAALTEIYRDGHERGRQEGYDQGFQEGFQRGRQLFSAAPPQTGGWSDMDVPDYKRWESCERLIPGSAPSMSPSRQGP